MSSFKEISLSLRHRCVKLLAPKLYADWFADSGKDTPDLERPMINFLTTYFQNKPLVGCEIGVREGINADRILRTLNITKLYLVDPYLPYYEPVCPVANSIHHQEQIRNKAHDFLASHKDKIVWLLTTSDNAVKSIPDYLDFCYIDGDHNYNQVKRDIQNYSRLINKDGVLGGHDFGVNYLGLCRAVIENVNLSKLQGKGSDWWFMK